MFGARHRRLFARCRSEAHSPRAGPKFGSAEFRQENDVGGMFFRLGLGERACCNTGGRLLPGVCHASSSHYRPTSCECGQICGDVGPSRCRSGRFCSKPVEVHRGVSRLCRARLRPSTMGGQPMMCRTPENVPGVRCRPVWPREETQWLAGVETHYPDILQELFVIWGSCGTLASPAHPGSGAFSASAWILRCVLSSAHTSGGLDSRGRIRGISLLHLGGGLLSSSLSASGVRSNIRPEVGALGTAPGHVSLQVEEVPSVPSRAVELMPGVPSRVGRARTDGHDPPDATNARLKDGCGKSMRSRANIGAQAWNDSLLRLLCQRASRCLHLGEGLPWQARSFERSDVQTFSRK